MEYFVYFLKSLKDKMFYIGYSSMMPEKRLMEYHNKGFVKSTKCRLPFVLCYYEIYNDKRQACRREFYLKSVKGYQEKRKIIGLINLSKVEALPIIVKKY